MKDKNCKIMQIHPYNTKYFPSLINIDVQIFIDSYIDNFSKN